MYNINKINPKLIMYETFVKLNIADCILFVSMGLNIYKFSKRIFDNKFIFLMKLYQIPFWDYRLIYQGYSA